MCSFQSRESGGRWAVDGGLSGTLGFCPAKTEQGWILVVFGRFNWVFGSQARMLDRAETIIRPSTSKYIHSICSSTTSTSPSSCADLFISKVKYGLIDAESRWLPLLLQTLNPSMSATSMSCSSRSLPIESMHTPPLFLTHRSSGHQGRHGHEFLGNFLIRRPLSRCACTDCTFRQSSISACWATEGAHRRDMRTTQTTAMTP